MKAFQIDVSQEELDDLKMRLENTRWTENPEDDEWRSGTNANYLRKLVTYWKNGFDWRAQEAMLNSFPQFRTTVDGIELHFIYVKGKGSNAKPLILTHGWPDSFYRFYKVIPMLADPEAHGGNPDQSFDVVVPSIPGFGFSEKIALTDERIAGLWASLMKDILGYNQYFAAGGDVGSGVSRLLANQFPDQVRAIHLTDVGYPDGTEDWRTMSPAEQDFGAFINRWWMTEGAYNMIQSTKPQTLGYGLNDSPVGLAAWIVEKFHGWSDHQGNLENRFTKDELLTNVMIYWVTRTINTSIRYYAVNARANFTENGPKAAVKVEVPAAVACFPGDAPTPEEWAARRVNLNRFKKFSRGGHFAPLEVPELYVDDLRAFFFELAV